MIDTEIKTALDDLRTELGKNVQGLERVDALEKLAREGHTTVAALRTEMDELKAANTTFETALEGLKRDGRRRAIERDGMASRGEAMAVLGALGRQLLCRAVHQEIPQRFREPEETLIRDYRERLSRDTLEVGSTPGSALVPTILETEIIDAIEDVSEIVSLCDLRTGLPGNVDFIVRKGRPTLRHGRATVDTTMTKSPPDYDTLQFRPEELYVYVPVDNRLLQMSAVNLGQMLAVDIRDGAIDGLAKLVVEGGGPGSFHSILLAAAAYRYSMGAGKTAFADLAYLDLVKMKASCLKRGRARGRWIMAEDVLWSLGDKDRTGKHQILSVDGGEPKVLYKPAVIDESMPDLDDSAVDTPFVAFGDLATMLVGLVGGMQLGTSEHYLFGENQTAFRLVMNGQILRKPVKTLVTGRTAAA